jgi:hypothetical protein
MMGVRDGKAGIQEIAGRSLNAPLEGIYYQEPREKMETMAGGMGGAANSVARNLDAPEPKRASAQDRIEAQLAPLLWRLKFARDATRESALSSALLFAEWMRGRSFGREQAPVIEEALLRKFAARALYEWLVDRCAGCGGTGLQELLRGGQTRRTRRFGDWRVRHVICRACKGTRRPRVDKMSRARALEISLAEYDARWPHRFFLAGRWVNGISRRLTNPLRCELERCINSSCRESGMCQLLANGVAKAV